MKKNTNQSSRYGSSESKTQPSLPYSFMRHLAVTQLWPTLSAYQAEYGIFITSPNCSLFSLLCLICLPKYHHLSAAASTPFFPRLMGILSVNGCVFCSFEAVRQWYARNSWWLMKVVWRRVVEPRLSQLTLPHYLPPNLLVGLTSHKSTNFISYVGVQAPATTSRWCLFHQSCRWQENTDLVSCLLFLPRSNNIQRFHCQKSIGKTLDFLPCSTMLMLTWWCHNAPYAYFCSYYRIVQLQFCLSILNLCGSYKIQVIGIMPNFQHKHIFPYLS